MWRDEAGGGILHYAAGYRHREAVDYLLSIGCRWDLEDLFQISPLHIARNRWEEHDRKILGKNWEKRQVPRHYFKAKHDWKLLIIINPVSGSGTSMSKWEQIVQPVLSIANIQFEVVTTNGTGHAFEIARSIQPEAQFDAIITLGGDGTLFEVINGLHAVHMEHLAVGIIPCGSGNVVSTSLGIRNSIDGTLSVISNRISAMDIFQTTQMCLSSRETIDRLGLVMAGWGFISACDFESEKWRWMGEIRFTLLALQKIIQWTEFPCRIHYTSEESTRLLPNSNGSFNIPNSWSCIHNPNFLAIVNSPYISATSMIAPPAKIDDGYLWLVVLQNQTRLSFVQKLLEMDSGSHAGKPGVSIIPVKQCVIEPLIPQVPMDVDGERQPGNTWMSVQVQPWRICLL